MLSEKQLEILNKIIGEVADKIEAGEDYRYPSPDGTCALDIAHA